MKATGKVYSYIRFSDAKQAAGNSSDRQSQYAIDWAKANGLQLDAELSMRDEGLSAFHQRHVKSGAFGVFLKAIEDGKVPVGSVLVVESLDRLSRAEPLQAQAQLTQIIMAGITVVTCGDNKAYSRESVKKNPMDLVYSLLVMVRANEEIETKRDRVSLSIRNACRAWVDGSSRKLIRAGNTPAWLEAVDGAFKLVPERVTALQLAVELYRQGKGSPMVAATLNERGMLISGVPVTSGYLTRLFTQPALYGEKQLEILGEVFELRDYYPPVMTRPEFDELQDLLKTRSRKHVRGTLPSLLTGTGVARCGYCGSSLVAQNMTSAPTDSEGRIRDCNRRLHCVDSKRGACSVAGSCSSVPVERALMSYCSDMLNLQTLYGGDLTALPRRNLAAVRAKHAATEARVERITDMLADGDGDSAALMKKLRSLEAELETLAAEVKHAEAELKAVERADITDADVRWRSVAEGVTALDYDARMQARQMVADTFEAIVVYHHGYRPAKPTGLIRIELRAKGGGVPRHLDIDAKTGEWVAVENTADAPSIATKPAGKKPVKRVREFA